MVFAEDFGSYNNVLMGTGIYIYKYIFPQETQREPYVATTYIINGFSHERRCSGRSESFLPTYGTRHDSLYPEVSHVRVVYKACMPTI